MKVESKDKGPLSAGVIFTEDNSRREAYSEFVSPNGGGYYLQDENIDFKVYGNPATSTIKLQYRGLLAENKPKTSNLGVMVKDIKSNTYKSSVKTNREQFSYALKENNGYVSPKFVSVATSFKNDVTESSVDGYIAYYNREAYKAMDTSFKYNSPFDHSFKGYGTDGYNCMAYGLGITDQFIWPWSSQASGISYEGVWRYFAKDRSHVDRAGYRYTVFSQEKMANAQAIYYEGHVAVVTEWDKNGMPTKIISKWGGNELIESTLEGLVRWGDPLIYMKGRFDN